MSRDGLFLQNEITAGASPRLFYIKDIYFIRMRKAAYFTVFLIKSQPVMLHFLFDPLHQRQQQRG